MQIDLWGDILLHYTGFLLEKNLGGRKDNKPLFLKQQAIVPIVLSIVFRKF